MSSFVMTKWAILIGVDKCPGCIDLPGCLNDVKNISKMLQGQYGFHREHMVEMTCSNCYGQDHNSNFEGRIEGTVPTYRNIVSAFMTLEDEGRPGDLAYIHFSGVPTAVQSMLTAYVELPAVMDLALLTAGGEGMIEGEKWLLHDVELSALLNRLCEKGLEVTAILDCRSPPLLNFPSSRSDLSLLKPHELEAMSYGKTRYHFPDTWMRDPVQQSSYTLISSFDYLDHCPQKSWRDGRVDYEAANDVTKEKMGFLTSWLLDALHKSQRPVDFKQLLQLMKSSARDMNGMKWPIQRAHEMLAGNISRSFPGNACSKDLPRIPPAHASRLQYNETTAMPELEIKAGSLHGLKPGDKFVGIASSLRDILRLAKTGQSEQIRTIGTFQVTKVNAFSSTATPFSKFSSLDPLNLEVTVIQLFEMEAITSPKPGSTGYFVGTDEIDLLQMAPENQSVHYHRLLKIQSPRQLDGLIEANIAGGYRLRHHPPPTFFPSFDKHGQFHVLTDDHVVIHLRNRSDCELHVNIMAFDSAFGVSKVYPTLEDSAMAPVLCPPDPANSVPTTEVSIEFKLSLDNSNFGKRGHGHATEVLKIFFTDRYLSLSALEMPRIWHNDFLENNEDPAAAHFLPASTAHDQVEGLAKSKVNDDPGQSEARLSPEEAWYCHHLPIIIHSTGRSLEAALTSN